MKSFPVIYEALNYINLWLKPIAPKQIVCSLFNSLVDPNSLLDLRNKQQ